MAPDDRRPVIIQLVSLRRKVGKTTIGEKLVSMLRLRGYRVAVIKHGGRVDLPGKDSARYKAAGGDPVILIAETGDYAIFGRLKTEDPLKWALEAARSEGVDVIVIEGFKLHDVGIRVLVLGSVDELREAREDTRFDLITSSDPGVVSEAKKLGLRAVPATDVERLLDELMRLAARPA